MRIIWRGLLALFCCFAVSNCKEAKEDVDDVIEDELTTKLANDLLQSIERKFQVDLERSVDMVLVKIKLLLQNGTVHVQDKLMDLQGELEDMKKYSEGEVEHCLSERQNETSALAEKALHQMVVCGYALIGHDPAQAVKKVMMLKNLISSGLQPLQNQKKEVYSLLKACGHDHDTLKKVIKCVISKSPLIKSAMMDVTEKLVEGVVTLTKLMAHGAMHEACLIEVIKTTEDEASQLVNKVKSCVYGNDTDVQDIVDKYIDENNATVLEINSKHQVEPKEEEEKKSNKDSEIKELIRRMLEENDKPIDEKLKKKLIELQKDLVKNDVTNDINKKK